MSTNYKATFKGATKELTAKQRIAVKTFAEAVQLDEVTQENDVVIDIDYVATVDVHNEKADTPDYTKYVYVDKNGAMYVTGSESLYKAYEEIAEEMEDEEEDWAIKVIRKPSTNYKGKDFLSCVIV